MYRFASWLSNKYVVGNAFGNKYKYGGSNNSAPGTTKKKENGMNLSKSFLILVISESINAVFFYVKKYLNMILVSLH